MWINKTTRSAQSGPPWSETWVADSVKQMYFDQGWEEADEVPVFEKTKAEKSSAVIAEYQAKYEKLVSALTFLESLGKDTAAIKSEISACITERNVKLVQISKE